VRDVIEGKNLLATGDISPDEVVRLLRRCRGNQHSSSPHHWDPSVPVHVFRPTEGGATWYIKVYFVADADGTAVFLSVHQ